MKFKSLFIQTNTINQFKTILHEDKNNLYHLTWTQGHCPLCKSIHLQSAYQNFRAKTFFFWNISQTWRPHVGAGVVVRSVHQDDVADSSSRILAVCVRAGGHWHLRHYAPSSAASRPLFHVPKARRWGADGLAVTIKKLTTKEAETNAVHSSTDLDLVEICRRVENGRKLWKRWTTPEGCQIFMMNL